MIKYKHLITSFDNVGRKRENINHFYEFFDKIAFRRILFRCKCNLNENFGNFTFDDFALPHYQYYYVSTEFWKLFPPNSLSSQHSPLLLPSNLSPLSFPTAPKMTSSPSVLVRDHS